VLCQASIALYAGAGLVAIGIHTREYGFEHDVDNVRRPVNCLGIKYPIAIDNQQPAAR
jgi:hypothetical protein